MARLSNGVATERMEKVFVIATKYSVDTLMNLGKNGIRKNGSFALIHDYILYDNGNRISIVGDDFSIVLHDSL